MSDLAFIDGLQKQHTQMVGWMPTKQLEGKIGAGHVLVAEEVGSRQKAEGREEDASHCSALPTAYCPLPTPIGYCIGNDQYFKRDDVGIIYQMNIAPMKQRGLIGATLLKVMFERAAYGCRLFCCWCAQDIAANRFWEAMGFVPLAFRSGSRGKQRVHIFWQRRIRSGDTTTPYWFPSQTTGGSIREDRLVLPIPPGTHWSDAMPILLPGEEQATEPMKRLRGASRIVKPRIRVASRAVVMAASGGLWFASYKQQGNPQEPTDQAPREPRKKKKNHPDLIAAARQLRDRWLEQVNAMPLMGQGKYDVSKALAVPTVKVVASIRALIEPSSTGSTGSPQASSAQAIAA